MNKSELIETLKAQNGLNKNEAKVAVNLFFDEMAKVVQRSLQLSVAEQREIRIKKKAGASSDLALARVEIRVAALKARLSLADQERARALANLRILLGLKTGTKLELTDSLRTL